MTATYSLASLGYSSSPARAVALEIPMATLHGSEAPAFFSILVEVEDIKTGTCRAYLQKQDALGHLPLIAESVPFESSLLADLHNGAPDPTPSTEEDFEDSEERAYTEEEARQSARSRFSLMVRLSLDALDELRRVREAAAVMGVAAELEEVLRQSEAVVAPMAEAIAARR